MKKIGLILAIWLALTAFSGAQGGQGRQGFRMAGMEKMAQYMNLRRGDVQADLKLSDDQKSKITAAQTDMFGQFRQVAQDAQGDQEAMQAGMKKLMDGLIETLKGILTADQLKRLGEINIQMQGSAAVADPDVQKALKLSDSQIKQVKDLQAKRDEANQSLFEKMQSGDIDGADMPGLRKKNDDALSAAIEKVLTDDQKADLKKMGGAPFARDPKDDAMGFGFRRPAGGGGGGN